jgi:hypothetical protein
MVALDIAGTAQIEASAWQYPPSPLLRGLSDNIVINPGPPHSFIVSAPSTVFQGVAFNVGITVEDAYGNVVGTYAQTPTFSASDGTAVALSGITWSGGVGTAKVSLRNPGITTLTAADGGVTGTSGNIAVDARTSSNRTWAGYVVAPAHGTTAVGGTWIQPAVSGSGISVSSIWVGIDGGASGTVEQIGTDAIIVNGTPYYRAWYELFGDQSAAGAKGPDFAAVFIPSFAVHPGDTISAEVSLVAGTSRSFLFQITDAPANGGALETFCTTQTMQYVTPQLASAEWIVENPNNGALPLANFGQATFTGAWATIGGTTAPINGFQNVQAWNISSAQGNATTSNPPLVSRTLGFNEPTGGVSSSSFTVTFSPASSANTANAPLMGKISVNQALHEAFFSALGSPEQEETMRAKFAGRGDAMHGWIQAWLKTHTDAHLYCV